MYFIFDRPKEVNGKENIENLWSFVGIAKDEEELKQKIEAYGKTILNREIRLIYGVEGKVHVKKKEDGTIDINVEFLVKERRDEKC